MKIDHIFLANRSFFPKVLREPADIVILRELIRGFATECSLFLRADKTTGIKWYKIGIGCNSRTSFFNCVKGGEVMYWTKEFNWSDPEVKHLWVEYFIATGIFSAIVLVLFFVGVLR